MSSTALENRMDHFSLHSDCLVGLKSQFSVSSHSSFGVKYLLNFMDQTCTCEDFRKRRSNCQKDHLSRWCKHILKFANDNGMLESAGDWHKAIANEGVGGPFAAFKITAIDGQEFVATIGSSQEWANIFVRTALPGQKLPILTGPVRQFGWHIGEKRWSYGKSPRGAKNIRKLLCQIEGVDGV